MNIEGCTGPRDSQASTFLDWRRGVKAEFPCRRSRGCQNAVLSEVGAAGWDSLEVRPRGVVGRETHYVNKIQTDRTRQAG